MQLETDTECSECYPIQPILWRDQPMNPTIKEQLTYQRHANQYYHTLNDALAVWGQQIEEPNVE